LDSGKKEQTREEKKRGLRPRREEDPTWFKGRGKKIEGDKTRVPL